MSKTQTDYERVQAKYKKLKKAIQAFVLAEYEFRLGPFCFTPRTEENLKTAEADLRLAVGGSADLRDAAYSVDPDLEGREIIMRLRMKKSAKNGQSLGESMEQGEPKPRKACSLFEDQE